MSVTRGVGSLLVVTQGILSARYFGTSDQKDALLVAHAIPSMVTTFLIGGIYSTLMVHLAELGRTEGARGQRTFTRRILGRVGLALLLPLSLVLLAPAWLVGLAAPGFPAEKAALAASLLRFTVFASIGLLFTAAVRCMFEIRGQFVVPAIVGMANPLACVVVLVAMVGGIGIYTLAVGPLLGVGLGLLALVLLIPRYVTDPEGFHAMPAAESTAGRERGFWIAFLPMSLGANFGQINMVVDNAFASYLPTGSITMLGFAFVIISNAQMLTTLTFAEVAFSRLAASAAASADDLGLRFRSQVRHMLLLTAPLTIGALAFATPLVRLLFERGAFTREATVGVVTALRAYAPGMFFLGYLTLFTLLLISKRRFARISTTAAGIIVVNAVLDFVLMKAFGLTGIALGTTITIVIHGTLLLGPVRRIIGKIQGPGDVAYLFRVMTSALLMGGLVLGFSTGFERWFGVDSQGARLAEVLLGLGLGAGSYLVALLVLQVREVESLVGRIAGPLTRFLAKRDISRGPDGH
jgi:putative peptidoglycan lipid II flippase